jgi:ATP-dependent protease ClpP protease subunit
MPKKSRYEIKALGDDKTIYIYGDIGEDYWAEESNDAKTLVEKINSIKADELTVHINSYGGSVSDAMAIFNALRTHPATITTINDGVAISAASFIFMAGDNREMANNSLLMIHAPLDFHWDSLNASKHREAADKLDKYAEAMTAAYLSSGKSVEEIEELLKDGVDHYYTAEEALSEGFATSVTEAVQIAASGVKPDRYKLPAAWVAANQLNLKKEGKTMPKKQENTATTDIPVAESQPVKTEAVNAADVLAKETKRRADIRAAGEPFKDREGVTALLDKLMDDTNVSANQANQQILAHLGSLSEPLAGDTRIEMGETSGEKFVKAASSAVLMRAGIEKHESGNEFRGMTMMDLARESLVLANVNHRGMDKREVVGAALTHSTSDFPVLLENVMHKTLLTAYRRREFTWSRFCKRGNLADFRPHGRYRVGSFGNLDEKSENNEFKHKSLTDAMKNSIQLATKGNLISISREMIINDDMAALTDLTQSMAYAAGRTVESAVYAYLAANAAIGDGVKLFHATHKNLASSGSAVTSSALTAAKVAMKKQKDISGNDFLDIIPTIFVGGDAAAEDARKINEMKYDDAANQNQEAPNTNRGLFSDIIGSPRIDGNEWYLFADPMDAPVLEVGFLDGNDEPYLELKDNFTQDGATYKVRLDYAVGAVGHEGAFKNPGS